MSRLNIIFFHLLSYLLVVEACMGGGEHSIANSQVLAAPAKSPPKQGAWKKIAIRNVRVFNGTQILPPSTVVIDGARIGFTTNITVDQEINGEGGILIPGLIDAHAHPSNLSTLETLVSYGVTTVMSMACSPEPICNTLRGQTGLADFHTSGVLATSPGSMHASLVSTKSDLIGSTSDIPNFISNRIGNGSDYIKIVAESPGLSLAEQTSLVNTAHAAGFKAVTHTGTFAAYNQAIDSVTDIIQHIAPDQPVTLAMTSQMKQQGQAACPTLTIIKSFIDNVHIPGNFSFAQAGVRALRAAGVPILAGTDSNPGNAGTAPAPFGSSMHGELELLTQAGLSDIEALRAATDVAARHMGLWDRGFIKPGYRADLILLGGDPLVNISNTRNIRRVWAAGIEYPNVTRS